MGTWLDEMDYCGLCAKKTAIKQYAPQGFDDGVGLFRSIYQGATYKKVLRAAMIAKFGLFADRHQIDCYM